MSQSDEPKYGERRPSVQPVFKRDIGEPGQVQMIGKDGEPVWVNPPGEHRALGYTVMLVVIGIPMLVFGIPLCVWLTRLALGG